MFRIPRAKYKMKKYVDTDFTFRGINHKKSAKDGEIYDCLNLTSDDFPSISTRKNRRKIKSLDGKAYGMGSHDKIFWCAEDEAGEAYFYYDEKKLFPLEKSEKTFAVINNYICIFPDKKYYSLLDEKVLGVYETLTALNDALKENPNVKDGDIYAVGTIKPYKLFQFNSSGEWERIHDEDTGKEYYSLQTKWIYIMDSWGGLDNSYYAEDNVKFTSYYDDSDINCIRIKAKYAEELNWLRIGDTVKITVLGGNLGTSGKKIYTYYGKLEQRRGGNSNSERYEWFGFNLDFSEVGSISNIKIERDVPNLQFAFCHENRVWGIEEDKIRASSLGDPFNFNDYSSISSSSWALSIPSASVFTGGCVYNGYPMFFKENSIIRVGGKYPAQYSTYETNDIEGVMEGSAKSLSITDGVLYYLSPSGVMAYTGSYPYSVGENIGERLKNAFGKADKNKYYISAENEDNERYLYIFDTKVGSWMKEANAGIAYFCEFQDNIYALCEANATEKHKLCVFDEDYDKSSESFLEFAPIYDNSLKVKGLTRLYINVGLGEGAAIRVLLAYDGGEFKEVCQKRGSAFRETVEIPLLIKRCISYRLRIEGEGEYVIYGIGKERYYE